MQNNYNSKNDCEVNGITTKPWRHGNTQNNCETGKQVGDKIVPGFKINYQATVRKTV